MNAQRQMKLNHKLKGLKLLYHSTQIYDEYKYIYIYVKRSDQSNETHSTTPKNPGRTKRKKKTITSTNIDLNHHSHRWLESLTMKMRQPLWREEIKAIYPISFFMYMGSYHCNRQQQATKVATKWQTNSHKRKQSGTIYRSSNKSDFKEEDWNEQRMKTQRERRIYHISTIDEK